MPTESAANGRRVFFGCFPPAELAHRIRSVGAALLSDGRPVPEEAIHLTLAFLGNVSESEIRRLITGAGQIDLAGGELRLDSCGYFRKPGIVWLGPESIPGFLSQLHEGVTQLSGQTATGSIRRVWRPHVSVARNAEEPDTAIQVEPMVWAINSFELVESHPGAQGSVYRSLGRWPLRQEPSELTGRV